MGPLFRSAAGVWKLAPPSPDMLTLEARATRGYGGRAGKDETCRDAALKNRRRSNQPARVVHRYRLESKLIHRSTFGGQLGCCTSCPRVQPVRTPLMMRDVDSCADLLAGHIGKKW